MLVQDMLHNLQNEQSSPLAQVSREAAAKISYKAWRCFRQRAQTVATIYTLYIIAFTYIIRISMLLIIGCFVVNVAGTLVYRK